MTNLPAHSLDARLQWQGFDESGAGPFFLRLLSPEQQELYTDWLKETSQRNLVGETSLSAMGLLSGLALGNRLTRIVQCGHYAGYSLLILGMLAKNVAPRMRIASIDIDQCVTKFTNEWVSRGGLEKIAKTMVMDSADPFAADAVQEFLGGAPELVFIDSSHQYRHTKDELDLWASRVAPGGFICMHDAAEFSAYQDKNGLGGVNRALQEWCSENRQVAKIVIGATNDENTVYKDPCGFALLQIMEPVRFRVLSSGARKRLVKDPEFQFADQWIFGEGWSFKRGRFQKLPGQSTSVSCFSPVIAGERYRVQVKISHATGGGLHPGAGGSALSAFFSGNGVHTADIIAGGENSMIGLLASADFRGVVGYFSAEHLV